MKVNLDKRVYNVIFKTEAVSPKYGKSKDNMALVKTSCEIVNNSNSSNILVSRASVTQNYRDELKWETGRIRAMTKALSRTGIKKDNREVFWNTYKEKFPITK